jgi:hypothetical protein
MNDLVEKVAQGICQSGKFECGQGRCAALCMDSLGDIRKSPHGCSHALKLHGPLARAALRIALEEAAKVAEGYPWCGSHVAARIRSLLPEGPTR